MLELINTKDILLLLRDNEKQGLIEFAYLCTSQSIPFSNGKSKSLFRILKEGCPSLLCHNSKLLVFADARKFNIFGLKTYKSFFYILHQSSSWSSGPKILHSNGKCDIVIKFVNNNFTYKIFLISFEKYYSFLYHQFGLLYQ
jgi:hypothetical protein